ncbi:acyl-CoA thioesterase [Neoroseomonas oryzicola]|uniref:Acyl-CoA thioesterase n=1 Tax=Neoroseomonas oryzicola TaxID=535904 RepID=A0A9X9WNV9_9PROT|nr:thioesterase family protein [Neoroseomonas oryzicola]MBR0662019.1 acyl-CoA thioesterase [Neoroseomonas oryzicola]NKE19243.1 acyl-CoA thioesterase [Neoroseomonas oryzicola]
MPDGAGAGLPTRADFRFFRPHQVRYVELDTQGIVFNAHYLTWYDEAVSDYIRAAGWNYQAEVKASGADFHVVRGLVEYKVAIGRAARIEVAARTTRIGRSSITFLPAVFPQGEDTLLATGEIVWVLTDQATRRSIPIPDRLRAILGAYEGRDFGTSR